MIVLDASAALEMVLKTAVGARIEARVFEPDETLHAPHLIDVEVAHVLRRLAVGGADPVYCRLALDDWMAFPVERYSHEIGIIRAWELRANFTAYDAVYVALAEKLGAPLVTHDRKFLSRVHKAQIELI